MTYGCKILLVHIGLYSLFQLPHDTLIARMHTPVVAKLFQTKLCELQQSVTRFFLLYNNKQPKPANSQRAETTAKTGWNLTEGSEWIGNAAVC